MDESACDDLFLNTLYLLDKNNTEFFTLLKKTAECDSYYKFRSARLIVEERFPKSKSESRGIMNRNFVFFKKELLNSLSWSNWIFYKLN